MGVGSALLMDGRLGQPLILPARTGAGDPAVGRRGAAPDLMALTAQGWFNDRDLIWSGGNRGGVSDEMPLSSAWTYAQESVLGRGYNTYSGSEAKKRGSVGKERTSSWLLPYRVKGSVLR